MKLNAISRKRWFSFYSTAFCTVYFNKKCWWNLWWSGKQKNIFYSVLILFYLHKTRGTLCLCGSGWRQIPDPECSLFCEVTLLDDSDSHLSSLWKTRENAIINSVNVVHASTLKLLFNFFFGKKVSNQIPTSLNTRFCKSNLNFPSFHLFLKSQRNSTCWQPTNLIKKGKNYSI